MRKLIATALLAIMANNAMAYGSSEDNVLRASNLYTAMEYIRFLHATGSSDEFKNHVEPKKIETVPNNAEMYVIDGIKVIITDSYVKNKEEHLSRKANRSENDPIRMRYMEDCISLTQKLGVCKELWEERQK